jgi:hypothetical protein
MPVERLNHAYRPEKVTLSIGRQAIPAETIFKIAGTPPTPYETVLAVGLALRPAFILNRYRKLEAPIENEATVSFSRGVAYAYQSASPAHDRRYDRAAFRREDAEGLRPGRQKRCSIAWAGARD